MLVLVLVLQLPNFAPLHILFPFVAIGALSLSLFLSFSLFFPAKKRVIKRRTEEEEEERRREDGVSFSVAEVLARARERESYRRDGSPHRDQESQSKGEGNKTPYGVSANPGPF